MRAPARVALVGFMGSGKSTVGPLLASALRRPFVDTDALVESSAGLSVPEVFERHGESFFRDQERRAIRRALEEPVAVIATGGGAFMDEENVRLLLERAQVVHLACDFEAAYARVRDRTGRPLLGRGESAAAALYAERKEKYARSHVTVDTSRRSPDEVVAEIVRVLAVRTPENPDPCAT